MTNNESQWTWPAIKFTGDGGGIGAILGGSEGLTSRHKMLEFTLLWTLVAFGVAFGIAGLVAAVGSVREGRPVVGLILLLFVVGFGLVTALISGSVVGLLVGSIYEVGGFTMALWVPAGWAVIQTLVVIISSFAEIGLNSL
ncbi:hypothetical protein HDU98_006225 [Podochytrium sp. JEL0797]|nr:hypothetical protein HDU98_006225 [Podochytrium sp. JEL0797]